MKKIFLVLVLVAIIFTLASSSGVSATENKKWLTMEYQFDTRHFDTLNFSGYSDLPGGFAISGFTDFEGVKSRESRRHDLTTSFTEIDLLSPKWNDLGLISEINSATGDANDVGRFGLFYKPELELLKKMNLSLFFKGFPIETDKEGSQASFSWNLALPDMFGGRVSFGGFFDLNRDSDSSNHIVSDTQFRVRLIENLHFLVEYRYNEFQPQSYRDGFGIGLKYHF